MTSINTTCDPKFCADQQPEEIFAGITTLEKGVEHLRYLAEKSQTKLVKMLGEVVTDGVTFYDPDIKSYDSALRKAKASRGKPNQIRQLNDIFRASIIVDSIDLIPSVRKLLENELFHKYKFEIVNFKDTFSNPWSNGYRDINYRLKDLGNHGIVGELQINLCSIKKFTEFIGHKAYEISRSLPADQKNIVQPYLDKLTKFGYNEVSKKKEKCSKNNHLGGAKKTRTTAKKSGTKVKKTRTTPKKSGTKVKKTRTTAKKTRTTSKK